MHFLEFNRKTCAQGFESLCWPHFSHIHILDYCFAPRREQLRLSQVANVPFRLWLQVRVWVLCDNDAQSGTVAPFRLQSLVSVIEVSRGFSGAQVRSFVNMHGLTLYIHVVYMFLT